MRTRFNRIASVSLLAATLLVTSVAEAQWVLLARRAVGRIEQMSQSTPGSSAVYDTSAVIIDAPADKVYNVVAQRIRGAQGLTVTRSDEAQKSLEFTNGTQTASVRVSVLGDNLAHLMVSAASSTAPSPMASIVDHILAACRELKVECERAQN